MADVVVTVPKHLWQMWIEEGDLPGEPWNGEFEWDFYLSGYPPSITPGERVYVVAHGRLRGYAPLVRIDHGDKYHFSLVRRNDAVAVTIPEPIRGFRGWKYTWWDRSQETPFPNWREVAV